MLYNDEPLLGKSKEEVINYFAANNISWRLSSVDGQSQIGTCDHRIERRNLTIVDGKVTMITHG